MLYDEKAGTDITASEGIALLTRQMEEIGYEVVVGRGDFGKEKEYDLNSSIRKRRYRKIYHSI